MNHISASCPVSFNHQNRQITHCFICPFLRPKILPISLFSTPPTLYCAQIMQHQFVLMYSLLCGLSKMTYLQIKVRFTLPKSHLCKMGSQSNERRIKQFLLFFQISQSFSFSGATARDIIARFKNSVFSSDNITST